jgi:hypothetical protein
MDQNTLLPWGQPWNFLFNKGLDEPAIKQELSGIGQRLYDYIEESLGGNEHFSLQINCSHAADDVLHYQMYANLVVMKEAVVKWKQMNQVVNKTRIIENPLEILFNVGPGDASMAGSKPPPPPPPPPPRAVEMIGDAPPFRYLSNQFISSHVLNFSRDGELSQFNVRPVAFRGSTENV